MPRAHRHYRTGHVWHITQRCHQREFLLRFARDRECWLHWLFESKKRYGLSVLNYVVTSNHIHLMVCDQGNGEIARSLQLIAGRVGQAYNKRKGRSGAFWEDRYHATAVDTQGYLAKCLVYVDLNMVRAGVVLHPGQWAHCGFRELLDQPQRYQITDNAKLMDLLGIPEFTQLQHARLDWLRESLADPSLPEHQRWPAGIAWGSKAFVEDYKSQLGNCAHRRAALDAPYGYTLRENTS